MKINFERLLEKRQLRKSRSGKGYIQNFYKKVGQALSLLQYTEKSKKRNIKSEARKQFIISLVTALEVYLADVVVSVLSKPKIREKAFAKINQQFSLENVDHILRNKITIAELFCDFANFQDLNFINELFSSLFAITFFEYIRSNKIFFANSEGTESEINFRKDIYKQLNGIIQRRHKYVHDMVFRNNLSPDYLRTAHSLVVDFANAVEAIASEKILHNRQIRIVPKEIE